MTRTILYPFLIQYTLQHLLLAILLLLSILITFNSIITFHFAILIPHKETRGHALAALRFENMVLHIT